VIVPAEKLAPDIIIVEYPELGDNTIVGAAEAIVVKNPNNKKTVIKKTLNFIICLHPLYLFIFFPPKDYT